MPFGEDALTEARNRLKQRGLLEYTPGKRNKEAPKYRMHYFMVQLSTGSQQGVGTDCSEKPGNPPGKEGGNNPGNPPGKEGGNNPGNPPGRHPDLNPNVNPNPYVTQTKGERRQSALEKRERGFLAPDEGSGFEMPCFLAGGETF